MAGHKSGILYCPSSMSKQITCDPNHVTHSFKLGSGIKDKEFSMVEISCKIYLHQMNTVYKTILTVLASLAFRVSLVIKHVHFFPFS